jgi:transcriptional regulator with XRE-family HTH domain
MFYEILKSLAEEHSKSLNQIERELGYPRNALNQYKKGNIPSAKRTAEIAKYFGVTTNYLLGDDTTKVNDNLNEQENELLAAFRMETGDMTEEEQAEFQEAIKDLMKKTRAMFNDPSNWKK